MKFLIYNSNKPQNSKFDCILKKYDCKLFSEKDELNVEILGEYAPDYIFFPHWSYIIPANIYEKYECIVFHMTDLPFGRGGSPLQNLIVRGITKTKVSAIKVVKELDAGDIYLKKALSLHGRANEIYSRAASIVAEMIEEIIAVKPIPQPQKGEVVSFSRRTPEQSNIGGLDSLEEIYNFIRMLDAPGYPKAFLETENFIVEFHNAEQEENKALKAEVKIQLK